MVEEQGEFPATLGAPSPRGADSSTMIQLLLKEQDEVEDRLRLRLMRLGDLKLSELAGIPWCGLSDSGRSEGIVGE